MDKNNKESPCPNSKGYNFAYMANILCILRVFGMRIEMVWWVRGINGEVGTLMSPHSSMYEAYCMPHNSQEDQILSIGYHSIWVLSHFWAL
jgi:hypothetical protein